MTRARLASSTGQKLIGLKPVLELVRTVIWSGQVEAERPLSLILVADPGTGKTSVLERTECETAKFFSDLTSRELITALRNADKLTHIMLGDFLSLFGHQRSTVKLSVSLLARLTGDTVKQMPWSGEDIPPRKLGMLTAIPPGDLKRRDISSHIFGGGFATRFLIAKYDYSRKTIEEVHKYIRQGKYKNEKPIELDVKHAPLVVKVPAPLAKKIQQLSTVMKHDPIGFRAHRQLRSLAMAIARARGSGMVRNADIDKLIEFSDFFSEKGRTL
jgi:hypothetical protein